MEVPKVRISGESPISIGVIIEFVDNKFPEQILKMSLISEIICQFDHVFLVIPEDNSFGVLEGSYYIPQDIFKESWSRLSQSEQKSLQLMIYSGCAYTGWHLD